MEGDNITLEWRYTFGESESFLSMTFEKGRIRMVTKFLNSLFIANLYESRLRANITDTYVSITLLGVKRSETGSYTLKVLPKENGESTSTTVEISVLCKYKVAVKTRPLQHTKKNHFSSLKLCHLDT